MLKINFNSDQFLIKIDPKLNIWMLEALLKLEMGLKIMQSKNNEN